MTSVGSYDWDRLLRLIPGYDPFATAENCTFDAAEGARAVDFFRLHLSHVKGPKAQKPFVLEEWQQAIVANMFGWKRPDGTRRYREALIFVPRKNGKSLMAAGICNYMLFCDGEKGAEIYCAAGDAQQAALVFEMGKQQVLANKQLSQVAQVYRRSITIESVGSFVKVISAKPSSKHGFNSHGVVIDELHAQPDRELVDVLMTSTGARKQPLVVHITTSDFERPGSICNEKHAYASRVRDGVIQDVGFLPVIYEASREDDWTSAEVWKKANPCLGTSISLEYLEQECRKAQELPDYENTFKRLHLNIRTEQDVRWMPLRTWDACAGEVDAEALRGQPCIAALDLSSTRDISALVLLFEVEGRFKALPFFWLPKDRAAERERNDRVPYVTWARQKLIDLTPGNVIDYEWIRKKIQDLATVYTIKEVAIDPWNAQHLATELDHDGFEIVQFRQGFASMSSPTKELEKIVLAQQLDHGGHPVLRWMASNVCVEQDAAGNMKPSKKKSTEKIDGIVALVMALGRAIVQENKESVYEARGLLTL